MSDTTVRDDSAFDFCVEMVTDNGLDFWFSASSNEAHGDEGALGASRQNQWVIRMEPLFNFLIATLLDKKRDTHVMLLTTERLAKRPYFKVQHYKVITVDAIAVELPHKFAPTLLDAMQMLKMRNQEGNHAYGLVVIKCSNDGMVPAVIMPLDSADSEIPHYPADHILRLINEEPIT
eukprot:gene10025-7915_t